MNIDQGDHQKKQPYNEKNKNVENNERNNEENNERVNVENNEENNISKFSSHFNKMVENLCRINTNRWIQSHKGQIATNTLLSYSNVFKDNLNKIIYKALSQYQRVNGDNYFTLDFGSFQKHVLDVVYHQASVHFTNPISKENDREDLHLIELMNELNVNSDKIIQEGIIQNKNLMHECKKCRIAGRKETRNISSTYILPRGDEIGIDKLTCNTCGNKWSN